MCRIFRFLVLLICLFFFSTAFAQSDDITLIKSDSPLYYMENAFSETLLTSENEEAEITVSSVIVEKSRILVRFYVTGMPETWQNKIIDDSRLYGSYLPTAEIVLDSGTFLTPSSASRYSFLEYNSQLIIGGLLIFETDEAPQAFYFNFNQIPFDTKPLNEGFTKAVILSAAEKGYGSDLRQLSDVVSDAEFTVTATAQTGEATMLQPSVRMLRADETLTKFGWISFSDLHSGKRYAVTRGNLYGFNLTDDSRYSPAHAYVFSALGSDEPILITMDHIYAERAISVPQTTSVSINGNPGQILLQSDGIVLTLAEIRSDPEAERIRLYISCGNTVVSDISFSFGSLGGTVPPQVSCGLDPADMRFACDVFFSEHAFPTETISFSIDRIEYRKEGPWTLTWNPVPMEIGTETAQTTVYYPVVSDTGRNLPANDIPDEVLHAVDAVSRKNEELTVPGQWIHESYLVDYRLSDDRDRSLIPVDQAERYYTEYISEEWLFVSKDKLIHEIYEIVRDADSEEILSAQWQKDDRVLDLLHGLNAVTENKLNYNFSCFEDFSEIVNSSAVFTGKERCSLDGMQMDCLYFYQSLNGIPNSPGSQSITFYIDPADGLIRQEMIDYNLGALILTRKTLALENAEILPDDILTLTGSFE